MDFRTLKSLTIPEGVVTKITDAAGNVLWSASSVPVDYLKFSSLSTLSISVGTPGWDGTMYYSTDAETWEEWDGSEISGTTLYLAGENNTIITGSSASYKWTLTGSDISCVGNIETLLNHRAVTSGRHPSMAQHCYAYMFYGCTSLVQPPELPATTLAQYCYRGMFYNCSSLNRAPELPALQMYAYCYQYMFYGCSALVRCPELPSISLAPYCYYGMFTGCTALKSLPRLEATTAQNYCYYRMFYGCTSIKLSTTETDDYTQMYRVYFSNSISTALRDMFTNTGGTFTGTPTKGTIYYLDASCEIAAYYLTFVSSSTFSINVGTPGWDGILQYSTDRRNWSTWDGSEVTAASSTDYFTQGYVLYFRGKSNTVIAGGTTKNWTLTGTSILCIGNIETLLNYYLISAGGYPTMGSSCYAYMFYLCSSLILAPELPATTLSIQCYRNMFNGCTSLTATPSLPATTLATGCYYGMFLNCTSLVQIPLLYATTLPAYCYYGMFYGCLGVKLSEGNSTDYPTEYRIPASGTGTVAAGSLINMFSTASEVQTPTINTTYYLHSSNSIVTANGGG